MLNESNREEAEEIQDSQAGKRKRGRPRGDYSNLVDTIVNGHRIIEVIDGPRSGDGVMVIAECPECGKPYPTRLRRLRIEGVKGCTCVRSRIYRRYLKRKVSKLSREVIAGCWVSRRTKTRLQTAAEFGLQVELVDAAQREYQTELDSLIEDGTALRLYAAVNELIDGKFVSTEAAAGKFGLPTPAAQYLIYAVGNRVQKQIVAGICAFLDAQQIATRAGEIVELVAERTAQRWTRHKKRPWRNELTRTEFRRTRKGELRGDLVPFYLACKSIDRSMLNESENVAVNSFVEIAENTLSNRRNRQIAAIRKKKDHRSCEADARAIAA